MYTLYHNKDSGIIEVKKAKKALQRCTYTENVRYHNSNFYLCLKRKPLVEKAEEIKKSWIEETEERLEKLKAIKV